MKFGHSIDDSREKYPEITDDVLENLQAWAKTQDLPKIPEEQLALFFYSCYFNLEDTKRCMDVYYRMRTTIPEFFKNRDPRLEELQHSLKTLYVIFYQIVLQFFIYRDTKPVTVKSRCLRCLLCVCV